MLDQHLLARLVDVRRGYACAVVPGGVLLEGGLVLAGRRGDASSWTELAAMVGLAGIEIVPEDAALTEIARLTFLRYGKGRLALC